MAIPPLANVVPEPAMVPPVQLKRPLTSSSPALASVPSETVNWPTSPMGTLGWKVVVPATTVVLPPFRS